MAALAPALAVLGSIPLCLALGAWAVVEQDEVVEFVVANRGSGHRVAVPGLAAGGALVLAAWVGVALGRTSVERVRSIAWRLSPALPLGLAPFLFHWRAWHERPLVFLVLVLALGLVLRATLARALAEPPLLPDRLRARLPGGLRGWLDAPLPARDSSPSRTSPAWREAAPLALVCALATAYAVYFAYFTLRAHEFGYTKSYDLGIFDNLLWNLVHGGGFFQASPATGPTGSHFGRHATWLAYAIAPLYALWQRAETLLVIQACLLGFAALPLYGFARRRLGSGPAALLSALYLLYPPLHGANLYDFHFLSVSVFFVFLLAHALESGRHGYAALAAVLVLSVREDVALALVVLGAWQLLSERRPRLGLALAAVGLSYFAVTKFVWMPAFEGADSFSGLYAGLAPPGRRGFGGVVRTLLTNPGYVLSTVLTAEKLLYTLLIFVPLCFLPLRRPIGLLFCATGVLFTLLGTGHDPLVQIRFQYTAFWTPYLFLACVLALDPGAGGEGRLRRAWLAALTLTSLAASYQFGAVFQRNTAGGGFYAPYPFSIPEGRAARARDRDALIAAIPTDARVAASEGLVPHLSNRRFAYTLKRGVHDAECVLIETDPILGPEREPLERMLLEGRHGLVETRGSLALFVSGADTRDNARFQREHLGPPPQAEEPEPRSR